MSRWEQQHGHAVTIDHMDGDPTVLTHREYNLQCHIWRSHNRAEPPGAADVLVVDAADDGRWLHCSVRALDEPEPAGPSVFDERSPVCRLFVTATGASGLSPIDGAVNLARLQLSEHQRISVIEPSRDSRYAKVPWEMSGLSRVIPLALRIGGFDLGPRAPRPQRLQPDWMYDS